MRKPRNKTKTKERGWGKEGVMTQSLYAHMNKGKKNH
jgi:hypothetical protein